MHALPSTLYTAAFALFAFSAGVLARRTRPTARPGYSFFTAFLALQAAVFACELLMVHPSAPAKSLWLGLRLCLSLLQAPALWLAMRELLESERPSLSAIGWRDRVAMVVACVATVPLLLTAHGGVTYVNPTPAEPAWHARWIHEGMLLCIAVFALQAPRYLWRCWRLFMRADHGERPASRWLHLPLIVVTATWLLGVARTLQCAFFATPPAVVVAFAALEVGVTASVLCLLVRRVSDATGSIQPADQRLMLLGAANAPSPSPLEAPAIPSTEPEVRHVSLDPRAESRSPGAEASPVLEAPPPGPLVPRAAAPRYAKSRLDAATRTRIRRKLEEALERPDVVRNSLLDLRTLSRAIQEKAHYISQVINQDLDTSFYDLVSRHRVAQAQALLLTAPGETILEIALAVGFNSKSTFNAAFRRHTGKTPRQFRAERGI